MNQNVKSEIWGRGRNFRKLLKPGISEGMEFAEGFKKLEGELECRND